MKSIVITSCNPGGGKTTIAVNLAAGFIREGIKAGLSDLGRGREASAWMDNIGLGESVCSVDRAWQSGCPGNPPVDLLLVDLDGKAPHKEAIMRTAALNLLIVPSRIRSIDFSSLAALDKQLSEIRSGASGFDLIVPNIYDPREWEQNEAFLDKLAESVGWERIANPIVHWTRIEELRGSGSTVWDLPVDNLKQPFRELIQAILEMVQ